MNRPPAGLIFRKALLRWLLVAGLLTAAVYLMVSPGDKSLSAELSGLFGGDDLIDAIGHSILFAILTGLTAWVLMLYMPRRRAISLAAVVTLLLGLALELGQSLVPFRGVTAMDLVANMIGPMIVWSVLKQRRIPLEDAQPDR